ncbi:MAG TPA: hypothetical protein VEG28_03120 [Dehalococcoidia bacterium]|nr:hypothetical protein [Dehalococcoidia bacterium]
MTAVWAAIGTALNIEGLTKNDPVVVKWLPLIMLILSYVFIVWLISGLWKDPASVEARKESLIKHWDDLENLSQETANNLIVPQYFDQHYAEKISKIPENLDGIEAVEFLNASVLVDPSYLKNKWLYPELNMHLQGEDRKWQDKVLKLREAAVELHNQYYFLANAVVMMGKQSANFPPNWQIWVSASRVGVDAGEHTMKVGEAVKLKRKDIIEAQEQCELAIKPVKDELQAVSKRHGRFNKKCPICL